MTGRKAKLVSAVVIAGVLVGLVAWFRSRETSVEADAVRRALAAGQYAEAEASLRRWLTARPDSAEAHYYRGRVALAFDRAAEAADGLKRAAELHMDAPQLDLLRAMLASKMDRFAEAEPVLRKAFENAQGPDPQVDEALARVYLKTYDLNRAANVIDRWARDAPNDPKPYLWRAEIDSRASSEAIDVLNDYRQAVKRAPTLPEARLGLANELRKGHRNDEAATEYEAYLKLKPDDATAHLGAGQNLLEKGDEAAGIRHLERALALDPKNASALKEFAELDVRHGNFPSALAYLDRAIALNPLDLAIRHRRGLALTRLGRTTEAEKELATEKALRAELEHLDDVRDHLIKYPQDRKAQVEVARWMFDHDLEAEGVQWAEKILREQPGNPEASRLLADHHERKGNAGLANFYRLQASSGASSKDQKPKP